MFDQALTPRKKVAIIGAGISGLSAAYKLAEQHSVTLFEAEDRLGGHARTVLAGKDGTQPVDTGFIVFNYATYPYLTALFDELDVPVVKSEMSFGANINEGWLEYSVRSFPAIFAQKRNLLRPAYYKMLADIMKFGREAETVAESEADMTIADLIARLNLGAWFRDYYLLPMCGAIWSTPLRDVEAFPAKTLVRFFKNHALLAASGQHQWWTVDGGSIEYVRRLAAAFEGRGGDIRLGTPVLSAKRQLGGVHIKTEKAADGEHFDEVIFACHSDQALKILGEHATPEEADALGSIRYQTNRVVLHADESIMPNRKGAWASWNYHSQDGDIGVTYWMNSLQNIASNDPLFVTLNPTIDIAEDKIYDVVDFAHPMFDHAALDAQKRLSELQGENNTWFVGAYHRHGFHEDGIASAMAVVEKFQETVGAAASTEIEYKQAV